MKTLKVLFLGLALALVAFSAQARTKGITTEFAVVCDSMGAVEAAHATMNEAQLKSLGCYPMPAGVTVEILPPTDDIEGGPYLVAYTTPARVFRFWVNGIGLGIVKP